jgi:site-specific recombinase XerC
VCASKDIHELTQVQPFHVAAFVHDLQDELSPPSVKQHLAAIRMLFDWLVTGHVIETNPAHAVREAFLSVVQLQRLACEFRSFFWVIIDSSQIFI